MSQYILANGTAYCPSVARIFMICVNSFLGNSQISSLIFGVLQFESASLPMQFIVLAVDVHQLSYAFVCTHCHRVMR